jgi:hypothetical protein
MSGDPGAGWFPIRVYRTDAEWFVDWCRLGDLRFSDPFFEQTVSRCLRPFNLAFRRQTALDDLAESPGKSVPLAGCIFHLSRCGSTLISQTFAALPGNIVISEAGPIDEVLRMERHDPGVTDEQRVRRLRAIVGALCRRRDAREQRCIIKFDAWHTRDLTLIERAFPDVPWIFAYRDPLEILVSHSRNFGWIMAAVNAPSLLGVSVAESARIPRAEYHARVLARICEWLLEHHDRGALVHYDELPEAIWDRVAPLFRISLSADERALMRRAASRDAKRPDQPFVDDRTAKRGDVDEPTRAAAEGRLMPAYERIETLRRAQLGAHGT